MSIDKNAKENYAFMLYEVLRTFLYLQCEKQMHYGISMVTKTCYCWAHEKGLFIIMHVIL